MKCEVALRQEILSFHDHDYDELINSIVVKTGIYFMILKLKASNNL